MAGMGSLAVTRVGATDEQHSDAQRGSRRCSSAIGLERRWSHFALQAELRGVAVDPPHQDYQPPTAMPVPQGGNIMQPPPEPTSSASLEQTGGIVHDRRQLLLLIDDGLDRGRRDRAEAGARRSSKSVV